MVDTSFLACDRLYAGCVLECIAAHDDHPTLRHVCPQQQRVRKKAGHRLQFDAQVEHRVDLVAGDFDGACRRRSMGSVFFFNQILFSNKSGNFLRSMMEAGVSTRRFFLSNIVGSTLP